MKVYVFDIETIPDPFLPKELMEFDPDKVKIPANYKKQEAIDGYLKKAGEEHAEKIIKKLSCEPFTALPICFVSNIYDTEKEKLQKEEVFYIDPDTINRETVYDKCFEMLHSISKAYKTIPIITFAGSDFDFQVLCAIAMRYDISIDPKMINNCTKRYSEYHYDLNAMLKNFDSIRMKETNRGLDFFCKIFGIQGKIEGFSGKDVYTAYYANKKQTIIDYCKNDVLITTQLFKAVLPWLNIKR